jgi:hypothetical protein
MARKQAEMEARLKFNRSLQVEARGMDHSHNITEAFVFSYYEFRTKNRFSHSLKLT